jgi:hypothetical protein
MHGVLQWRGVKAGHDLMGCNAGLLPVCTIVGQWTQRWQQSARQQPAGASGSL